jgi:hypothetical protein
MITGPLSSSGILFPLTAQRSGMCLANRYLALRHIISYAGVYTYGGAYTLHGKVQK